ncbi:MAG: hypothetical protein HUU38_11015 [Anaerolineales bacterium]|nr:hypothetical protein [Anaerolineales bacterium]
MRVKKLILILAVVLPFVMVAANALANKSTLTSDQAIWELSKLEVISEGQVVEMKEGLITSDYILEGQATSKNDAFITEGVFRLTLTAFSPYEAIGAQKPGYWYVQGTWTLTKNNPNLEAMQAKHNSEVVEGTVIAEIPFDPTKVSLNWTGLARLNMSLLGNTWTNGEGTLTFNQDQSASLFLDMMRWPELQLETSK